MANIFNAAQYLELYPAIAEYGYNEANAWDHFVQYGAAELRTPNDELKGKVYAESVLNYANGNPELAEYFGVVVPAESLTAAQQGELLLHYVMYGNAEERENKIIDAPVQSEDADLTDLRDALETVVAADADVKEAVEAAVEGLEIDDLPENATLDAQEKAVETEYTKAAGIIQSGDGEHDLAIPGFAGVEDAAVRTQLIEAKQAQLTVVAQQAATELGKNKGLVDAYLNAQNRLIDLNKAKDEAEVNAVAEGAKAGAFFAEAVDDETQKITVKPYDATGNKFVFSQGAGDNEVSVSLELKNGKVEFVGGTETEGLSDDDKALVKEKEEALVKEVKAVSNYDALVQQLQTNADLATQEKNAQTVFNKAGARLDEEGLNPEGGDAKKYIDAQENVTDFNDLVADFREVEAYQNAIDEANAAKKAAEEALEELGYEINDTGFGTPEDDLFVYGNDNATVYSFGEQGEDLFFFGNYSFEELKPNDDFKKGGFGDRNVLEIFAQQQGTDVVLYVETNEVGGNALGLDNVNTITLVGVNLEDLSFDSGAGFLVA